MAEAEVTVSEKLNNPRSRSLLYPSNVAELEAMRGACR